ncbi:uncharacterized protein TM35_000481440 [Trypanosoma theileri]|uniref:Uncharacterized protein n=1 Tax=Trypanosoma theileri TaxID=67003 RepID=A0A1X0NI89_9TRYP|nr:uncharacterized protein TM35_000481440 [Trypanosoma theileri]ORC84183.1 hypothetical protein TM35_000481440 [Trypanosoma theileri]
MTVHLQSSNNKNDTSSNSSIISSANHNSSNNNNSSNYYRNDMQRHPPPLTLQCMRCQQRIICCPGCGTANLIILDSHVSHDSCFPTTSTHNSVSNVVMFGDRNSGSVSLPCGGQPATAVDERRVQMSSHASPTAFEMFCRDAEAQRCLSEKSETEEERCSRRRLLAEMWLSADTATREHFEMAAAAITTAVESHSIHPSHTARPSRTGDRRCVKTAKRQQVTSPATVDAAEKTSSISSKVLNITVNTGITLTWTRRRPPTAYSLFCKHQCGSYKTSEALMCAWKMMSLEEKKPYDDGAAAIRVALQN